MQTQILATIFALIFLTIEAIWLVVIRNRYIILISCATILVGVQLLSLIMIRDHFRMGGQYFLEYFAKLLLKDSLLIFAIWIFFYTPFSFKRVREVFSPIKIGNPIHILTGFDQVFSEVKPITKAYLVIIPYIIAFIAFVISPVGLLFSVIPFFWPLLIVELLAFPSYLTYSSIYRFLPPVLKEAIGDRNNLIVIGWLLYFSLGTSIVFTKRSFWFVLYLLFIFLLINNVAGCQHDIRSWPDG